MDGGDETIEIEQHFTIETVTLLFLGTQMNLGSVRFRSSFAVFCPKKGPDTDTTHENRRNSRGMTGLGHGEGRAESYGTSSSLLS